MALIQKGYLSIDPVSNPAVFNTHTWDPDSVVEQTMRLKETFWEKAGLGGAEREKHFSASGIGCRRLSERVSAFLLDFPDGQKLLSISSGGNTGRPLEPPRCGTEGQAVPLKTIDYPDGLRLSLYGTEDRVLHRFLHTYLPEKAPRVLGAAPRLGIGCRMTTAVWPAVWRSMHQKGYAANAIQNSLRELLMLDDVINGVPTRENYLFSFGSIAEGHTGSTFEGLWTAGVLSFLESGHDLRYGADADHIQVKRGPEGIERAKKVIKASQYYTFFTLDISDILDFSALDKRGSGDEYLARYSQQERKEFLSFHADYLKKSPQSFDEDLTGLFSGKYATALDVIEELNAYIAGLKGDIAYDLELSIDETPAEIDTCGTKTSLEEVLFLLAEIERRNIPVTHIAPNLGVEKAVDYRCPDGREGLAERVRAFTEFFAEKDILLDCHSGDDLSRETRRCIGRASGGRIHFKISPSLQLLFAEVLNRTAPEAFEKWWKMTYRYVQDEAAGGAQTAIEDLKKYRSTGENAPSPHDDFFHDYHFAVIGRRNEKGGFINRDFFYTLPKSFFREYTGRLTDYLNETAGDVL